MTDTPTDARAGRTAIIDVGSNSVRLVIFGHSERAPLPLLNEKAFCELGLGVSETGTLNPAGVEQAIATLKRFARLIEACGVSRQIAFATAAVRDATDGPAFVAMVRSTTGIALRVLSGEKEAELAGLGVLFGMPQANGVTADMGGSSLELVPLKDGRVLEGASLPLGPLQFSGDAAKPEFIARTADKAIRQLPWLSKLTGQSLYLVGGTWRAFAKLDIGMRQYPMNIVDGYQMSADRARDLASLVSLQSPNSLGGTDGISKRRMAALPVSALVLGRILEALNPMDLIFSAHGVREGAYLEQLVPQTARTDPLLAGIEDMASLESRFSTETGLELAAWIAPLFTSETSGQRRLRTAACLLCDVGWRSHPDYRATQSFRRVLRAPLIGLTHADRCFLGIAVLRRYSHKAGNSVKEQARLVLEKESIREAEKIGAAMRLALTLSGGTKGVLDSFGLAAKNDKVLLHTPEDKSFLIGEAVHSRLRHLASLCEATPAIVSAVQADV